ncbi:MAG: thioesterase family protein [bacterium]|nr:thioesterase family protein [bacterium]
MEPRTHKNINEKLCGRPVSLALGQATVEMEATAEMVADDRGLIHGGFVFGMADYAAMLAVNDPYVVLGAAEARFLRPCQVGDKLTATAEVQEEKGKKRLVQVYVRRNGEDIFTGTFTCFALEHHVLD